VYCVIIFAYAIFAYHTFCFFGHCLHLEWPASPEALLKQLGVTSGNQECLKMLLTAFLLFPCPNGAPTSWSPSSCALAFTLEQHRRFAVKVFIDSGSVPEGAGPKAALVIFMEILRKTITSFQEFENVWQTAENPEEQNKLKTTRTFYEDCVFYPVIDKVLATSQTLLLLACDLIPVGYEGTIAAKQISNVATMYREAGFA
jgi:hypothetical protein